MTRSEWEAHQRRERRKQLVQAALAWTVLVVLLGFALYLIMLAVTTFSEACVR